MKKLLAPYKELIQIALLLVIAVISGIDMIGEAARLVHIPGLSVGALGTGVAIGVMVGTRRTERRLREVTTRSSEEHAHLR